MLTYICQYELDFRNHYHELQNIFISMDQITKTFKVSVLKKGPSTFNIQLFYSKIKKMISPEE